MRVRKRVRVKERDWRVGWVYSQHKQNIKRGNESFLQSVCHNWVFFLLLASFLDYNIWLVQCQFVYLQTCLGNTPSHPMEGGHKYKLVSKNNTPKGTREVDKWGLFGTKVKEWRGAGRGVFWDGWSEGTKDEKWSDYEDLLGRGLHTHIHVLAAWMSVVFVAPEAGALHSHLCLGTHPHAHTQSWLMHKHNLLFCDILVILLKIRQPCNYALSHALTCTFTYKESVDFCPLVWCQSQSLSPLHFPISLPSSCFSLHSPLRSSWWKSW